MAAKNYDEITKMKAKATGASEADVVKAQVKEAAKSDGFVDLKKSKAELADEKKMNKASCCIGSWWVVGQVSLRADTAARRGLAGEARYRRREPAECG
jgi:hypothetical protein